MASERHHDRKQQHPQRRRRRVLSCLECRRRKIRCNQESPCSHCLRHNDRCTYVPYANDSGELSGLDVVNVRSQAPALGPATLPPSNNTGPSSPGMSAISQSHRTSPSLSQGLDFATLSPAGATAVGSTGPTTSSSSRKGVGHHYNDDEADNRLLRTILQKLQNLENSAGTTTGASPGEEGTFQRQCQSILSSRQAGERVVQNASQLPPESLGQIVATSKETAGHGKATLSKPRDLGRGDWTQSAPEFAAIIACWGEVTGKPSHDPAFEDPRVAVLIEEAGDLLNKCKQTAKLFKLSRPTRGLLLPSPDWLLPPQRQTCDALVQLYFGSFESTHRILHVPSFWADYNNYWDEPQSHVFSSQLTILLVVAIGSSLSDYATPDDSLRNRKMVHQWIYAAETWLAGPLEKERVSLAGLQIYCLTLLARQIFSIGGDTVWMSTGSLLNRAMHIGLHRDPASLPGNFISPLETELRRRLWATILELVLQASLDSRMPPRISSDEFDTQPPLNLDDTDIDDLTATASPHSTDRFTGTSVQLALLESFPVRLQILALMKGAKTASTYQHVLALSAELTNALQANARLTREKPGFTPFHRNMLDYLVRRFMIPLHFFYSNQSRTNPAYYFSLKKSVDAATAIMSPEPDAGFSKLMASGGGMFREGLRLAIMAVGLDLLIQVQTQRQDGTLRRAGDYLYLQRRAIRDMISLFEERIRQGETNVQNHMILGMILGQVNAIETGAMVEQQLAASARDSLEHCYNMLSARADEEPPATNTYVTDLEWEPFFYDQTLF